jgi:hypothetical protein
LDDGVGRYLRLAVASEAVNARVSNDERRRSPSFPGEIYQPSRRWAEGGYSNLSYFNEVDKGGHFAAWEEPLLFASEMRAALRSLR